MIDNIDIETTRSNTAEAVTPQGKQTKLREHAKRSGNVVPFKKKGKTRSSKWDLSIGDGFVAEKILVSNDTYPAGVPNNEVVPLDDNVKIQSIRIPMRICPDTGSVFVLASGYLGKRKPDENGFYPIDVEQVRRTLLTGGYGSVNKIRAELSRYMLAQVFEPTTVYGKDIGSCGNISSSGGGHRVHVARSASAVDYTTNIRKMVRHPIPDDAILMGCFANSFILSESGLPLFYDDTENYQVNVYVDRHLGIFTDEAVALTVQDKDGEHVEQLYRLSPTAFPILRGTQPRDVMSFLYSRSSGTHANRKGCKMYIRGVHSFGHEFSHESWNFGKIKMMEGKSRPFIDKATAYRLENPELID